MTPEKALQKLNSLFQDEIKTACEHLCSDNFDVVSSVMESAEKLRCFGFLLDVLGAEAADEPANYPLPDHPEHLDALGSPATIEDFLRAVNANDMPNAVGSLAQILGIPPQSAAACVQTFVHKWKTDETTFAKVKQFVATQNPNQQKWLLYELFGITHISHSA